MPLFSHHNNKDTVDTHDRSHGHGNHAANTTIAPVGGGGYDTGRAHHNMMGPGPGPAGGGVGYDEPFNDFNNAGTGTGTGGLDGPGYHHHQGPGAGTGNLAHGQGHQAPGTNMQGQYTDGGYSGGQHHHNAGGIPPTSTLNNSAQSRGGAGHAFVGKVERTIGTMVGSSALKAKGLQKEQEANSLKLQGSELAEAERLEREALMRRERAVGHGAHPDNKHLGAGFSSGPGGVSGTGGAMPGGH